MKAAFILLLSVVIGFATSAQPAEVDYALIDHASEQVKYNGSVSQLSHDLTRPYTTEMEKARAIFAWVTHHVAYDIDFINEGRKTQFPKCRKKDDCRALFAKWELDYVEETAKSGKSICHGYALLFKTLCAHAGIQCSVVSGYTKQESGLVGRMGRLNHAWNIMLINGEYYNVDPTWGAGAVKRDDRGKLQQYVRKRNDYYWLTPRDKFLRNHFAKDTVWPATTKADKVSYRDQPYIRNYLLPDLDVLSPESGVIKPKVGDTIRFEIAWRKNEVERVQLNTNLFRNPPLGRKVNGQWVENPRAVSRQRFVPFRQEDSVYQFEYVITNKDIKFVEVLFDFQMVAKFRVNVQPAVSTVK